MPGAWPNPAIEVTVVAPEPGRDGASWVAAGMLAPVTEVQFGESELTTLLLEGAHQWPALCRTTSSGPAGETIGYDQSGTLTVAFNPSDGAALRDLLAYQQSLGLTAHPRTASQCRALVPALSPMVGAGVEVPGDHQVDNRALLSRPGLRPASGTTSASRPTRATELDRRSGRAPGRGGPPRRRPHPPGGRHRHRLPSKAWKRRGCPRSGRSRATSCAWAPARAWCPSTGPCGRWSTAARSTWCRGADGSVVVGATVEERGDDLGVQAGAVHQLLDDARAVLPGIDEMHLLESSAGLRPATPDNQPFIGWTALPGRGRRLRALPQRHPAGPHTAAIITDLFAHAAISAVPA